ncbi:MAG: Rrf2 family transcriptional regulator [Roseburia sp.]|nr:Rrf2 family transcriptional regulator [Roseburia sp.]
MIVSTKGRYALRVMIDLAQHQDKEFVPLNEIAKRQEISEKYLEAILKILVKEGLLIGQRGKKGGYKLSRKPAEYTAWDIISLTEEGGLAPVSCLEADSAKCPREGQCLTLPMWRDLNQLVREFFSQYTIADLACDNFRQTRLPD